MLKCVSHVVKLERQTNESINKSRVSSELRACMKYQQMYLCMTYIQLCIVKNQKGYGIE